MFSNLLRNRIGFDEDGDAILFIDEAQESLNLGRFVRFMKENWSRATVILSGSTLCRLFRTNTRYPVGRVTNLILGPFSFSEYLSAIGENHLSEDILDVGVTFDRHQHEYLLELFNQFLTVGGLPEIAISSLGDFMEKRSQIIADYEYDFIRLFGEELFPVVRACFRSVASFVGSPSKNSSVVSRIGSSMNAKINEVFARLESWHLFIRSEQKGPGPEGSHKYLPKRYMFDTGILRHFRDLSLPAINISDSLKVNTRAPLGGIIENQAAIEINRFGGCLSGWKKSSSGTEIDFVYRHGLSVLPIECKSTLSLNMKHTKGLCDYMNIYSCDAGVIISLSPYEKIDLSQGGYIINCPAYMIERVPEIFSASS